MGRSQEIYGDHIISDIQPSATSCDGCTGKKFRTLSHNKAIPVFSPTGCLPQVIVNGFLILWIGENKNENNTSLLYYL